MESHGFAIDNVLDTVKQKIGSAPTAAMRCARRSWPAARAGGSRCPASMAASSTSSRSGALMEKGLQLRTGQTHVQKYTHDLLRRIVEGKIDTTFLISHRLPLEEAPDGLQELQGTSRTNGPRSS